MHPYTRSLISAIPIPDPQLEKNKVLFRYDPSVHDYSEDKPEMVYIGHDHYVFGNKKEIEEYKEIREAGVPLKSVTIAEDQAEIMRLSDEDLLAGDDEFLSAPVHDTGSFWYGFFSFFLPILGLIAGVVFRKHNYIRNYKSCKKGAIGGLIFRLAIILFFVLMILLAYR